MRFRVKLAARLAALLLAAAGTRAQALGDQNHRAQTQVTAPRMGTMVDTSGALRTVSGIAGSFVAGPAHASGVVALVCAETLCIVKTDAGLLTPHGEIAAPPGEAVLATDGKRSVAYFAQPGEFFKWSMGGRTEELEPQDWNVNGEVLSIRLTHGEPEIAVRRDSSVWIVTPEGAARDTVPAEASGAVLLLDDGAVYVAGAEIVLGRTDGSEVRFALPDAVRALFRMGAEWVEIVTKGENYALRTSPGRERVYVLPAGPLPGGRLPAGRLRKGRLRGAAP